MATRTLQQSIDMLKATRDGYMQALSDDSVNPQADYSLEGQSVSKVAWRTSLLQNIDQIDAALTRYEPFEVTGIMR